MDHTSWNCPQCGGRFGTWGDEKPVSPCCGIEIEQECIDAVEKVIAAMRKKMLEDD